MLYLFDRGITVHSAALAEAEIKVCVEEQQICVQVLTLETYSQQQIKNNTETHQFEYVLNIFPQVQWTDTYDQMEPSG